MSLTSNFVEENNLHTVKQNCSKANNRDLCSDISQIEFYSSLKLCACFVKTHHTVLEKKIKMWQI